VLLDRLLIAFAIVGFLALAKVDLDAMFYPEHETVIGTAWALNEDGYIVTAEHVVKGHNTFKLVDQGVVLTATLVASDRQNDLAILHIEKKQTDFLLLQLHYKNGEAEIAYGFPLPVEYGSNLKMSKGVLKHQVFSTYFRVTDTKICPGNSGGPAVGSKGVIGIITESVWPFAGNKCSATAQGPTSDKIVALAASHGIVVHLTTESNIAPAVTSSTTFEIYAWR